MMKSLCQLVFAVSLALGAMPAAQAGAPPARVTVLFDAFGAPSPLSRGWGYAALVEYEGKRILFDTGGQHAAFASNVAALHVDLGQLDMVVLSHRHSDHTAGLAYVLQKNPNVKVYTPQDVGSFGASIAATGAAGKAIQRKVEGLPADLRYFGDVPAEHYPIDAAWPGVDISYVGKTVEVLPGVYLFATRSDTPGTLEMNEVSMAIQTPKGLALMVGCSHPGIEKIVAAAAQIDSRIHILFGGLHLLDQDDASVARTTTSLKETWHIERMAAGHCTGPYAQKEFSRLFGQRHEHAGVGAVIALP